MGGKQRTTLFMGMGESSSSKEAERAKTERRKQAAGERRKK